MSTQSHYLDSNFDVRSHYSDSAAVVATLYSLTATGAVGSNVSATNPRAATSSAATNQRSGVGLVEPSNTAQPQLSSSQTLNTNSLNRKFDKLSIKSRGATAQSHCATLQRPNGYFRSNHSLCSCNADSEVNLLNYSSILAIRL